MYPARHGILQQGIAIPAVPTGLGTMEEVYYVTFWWHSMAGATSYLYIYNINSGAYGPPTETTNTIEQIGPFSLGDTICIRVASKNSAGTSDYCTAVCQYIEGM